MKVSLNWLRRYLDITVPLQELCDKMVMSGFEVDGLEDLSATMRNVVAGRIIKLEKHPDADKLQICQLDVGKEEPVQIVTGADNVFEGALVPVALHDSLLPTGTHIKKGKLRGIASNGMLCSGEELCLKEADYPGAEVYGILILKEDCPCGTDMREILGLNDIIIDFSVTANRPDCQSVLGIAREVAVALKTPLRLPEPKYAVKGSGQIGDYISVEVRDMDLCPRYYGRVVKNVRIAPSPDWMQQCIKAAGMRPINNIVDITNFVMLETGQPMHAFNLSKVAGHQIIVRRAAPGEKITTLDGKNHPLKPEMLVIADADRPSCLAGVMGGLESEITEDTTDIFFEAAKFRRDSIRRTSRTVGMRTESSARFEKGVDITTVEYAMERALQLIDELDAGDIVPGVVDLNNGLPTPRKLTVEPAKINKLLGLQIPAETMAEILNRLDLPATLENGALTCLIPSRRDDIEGRADLAEEVMRVYGYHHIVGTPIKGEIVRGSQTPQRQAESLLKSRLTAQGVSEITTYSFINPKALDLLGLPEDDPRRSAVPLLNPLSEEYSVLRTQLVTSMLTVLATNCNRKNPSARLFELSKRFEPKSLPLTEQPLELPVLSIGLYGAEEDFFTLKGLVEEVFAAFGAEPDYLRSAEPFLHPGRQAKAVIGDEALAVFGELHPKTAEKFGIGTKAYVAEIQLSRLYQTSRELVVYKPLPKFPAVERDLALLCDQELPVQTMEKAIKKACGKLLEKVELFDVYQGQQIAEGKKSVAFSLLLRSPDKTLTDQDADSAMNKVLKAMEELGASIRS